VKMRSASLVFCIALGMTLACGKDGDNSSSDGGNGGGEGGDIGNEAKNVTGRFFYDSTANPADELELVLANWTDLSMRTFSIKSDGSLLIALSEFNEEQLYSFHLISGEMKIADLDLSSNSGLQSAFVYRGGYGFDLGDVIVPKDGRGVVQVPDSVLGANIGGGFSISGSDELLLEGFPAPSFATEVAVEPSFLISDAVDHYYGVINPLDALEIERVRSQYSALSFRVKSESADSVVRAFISRVSEWYNGVKLIPQEFATDSVTEFWKNSSYSLKQNETTFFADVVTGSNVINKLIHIKVEGKEPPQIERIRVIKSAYNSPPYLRGISVLGGVPISINYSLPNLVNGLTTPFCHSSGDVVLAVIPPKDMNGNLVLGDVLDQLEFGFEYYNQTSGQTTQIDSSTALIAPYHQDLEATVVGDYTESWQATSKTKIFLMGAGATALSEHQILLDDSLFPSQLGGKNVSRIKLKILFKNKNHPGKSGSVVWIRKFC
jgi:hypothetical protein